ncbi:MAG: GlsB/YeaQ/YmgE family stress response membrane protein [Phycisphaeraceae bacterium]|nr:GlsB/YeaQ/YmgE family stress response membrane protein [Phycisphaeraceae bacterium]MCB9847512.1 GlsB/YeaQ/YmgE family stress response membrane protein [Phycisphaeraceae bacterium]
MNIIIFLLIGLVAGWLAGLIMKGRGFGMVGNLVVGVLGAVAGGMIFDAAGVESAGLPGSIVVAVVGALVMLFFIGLIRKTAG